MRHKTSTLLSFALLAALTGCTAKPQTYTGTVTTEMCRDKHKEGLSAADCIRQCVKDGSPYALMVGDKLYKLAGNTAGLDSYAGEKASVYGPRRGDTIQVTSVSPPKS